MESVIHLLNNWGLVDNVIFLLNNWCQNDKDYGTRKSLEKKFPNGSVANRTAKIYFQSFPRVFAFSFDVAFVSRLGTVRFLLPIEQIKLYRKKGLVFT